VKNVTIPNFVYSLHDPNARLYIYSIAAVTVKLYVWRTLCDVHEAAPNFWLRGIFWRKLPLTWKEALLFFLPSTAFKKQTFSSVLQDFIFAYSDPLSTSV
jgi:hypothetical protein